jgi:hypothetical protein
MFQNADAEDGVEGLARVRQLHRLGTRALLMTKTRIDLQKRRRIVQ